MKNITQASLQDAVSILELQKLAYQSEAQLYGDFRIPPLIQTLDELKSDFAGKVFLKVQIENRVIGSVRGYQAGDTCYVERLIVHPDHHRQGIGTASNYALSKCSVLNCSLEIKVNVIFNFISGLDMKYSRLKR